MRIKSLLSLFFFFIVGTTSLFAQWDSNISQYWNMKNFYNPAFIGQRQAIEASLLHRRQWVGVTRAPNTSVVSLNMPLKFLDKQHGVGVLMTNDRVGLFSNTSFMGQYAFQLNFKKGKRLHLGLMGGMFNVNFDASKIEVIDNSNTPTDPSNPNNGNSSGGETALPQGEYSDKVPDAGIGAAWITPRYYVGVSVNHLWSPKFSISANSKSQISRTYYLVAGYNFSMFTPLLSIQPSLFYRTDEVFHQIDLTLRFEYKKIFNAGVSWRRDDGFIFLLGAKLKNIEAGYSYDLSSSAMRRVSSGSHEIFLKYSMPINKPKHKEPQKSIRLL